MTDGYIAVGHGTQTNGVWDCGCVDGSYSEADLMFPIAGFMIRKLRAHGIAIESDWDTENDKNITLCIRDANGSGAKVYISLHCDFNLAPSGTFPIVHPDSNEGMRLAQCLDNGVRSRLPIGTRGILRRADWEVTDTYMPACIFETGSIRADIGILRDQPKEYGEALACGLMDYFGIGYGETPIASDNPNITNPPATSGTEADILLMLWDESIVVGQLQRDLRAMVYEDQNGNELIIDDVYGPATEYAVKRLQSCHNLQIDGIYGSLSDLALMGEIKGIQQALIRLGYDIHADGSIGVQTDSAIRDIQCKKGLSVDGIIGSETRSVLGV